MTERVGCVYKRRCGKALFLYILIQLSYFPLSLPVFCLFSAVITLVFAVFVGQNVLMFIHREEEKKRGQLLMGGMNHNFFIYWVNTISKWWMQGWCLQSCSAEIERKLLTASFCHSFTWCISRAEWSRVGTVSTAGRKPRWDKPLLFSFQLTNSSLMCFLWKYIWTGLFPTVKLEI